MTLSISLDPVSGNFEEFKEYLAWLEGVEGVTLHCDVMDGDFVSRKAMSDEMYNHLVKNTNKKIDVHLMLSGPNKKINPYIAKAVWGSIQSVSFHVEALSEEMSLTLLGKIKTMGIGSGVVIDLDTDVKTVSAKILKACDVITIMSVKAGASGQTCDPKTFDKLKYLKKKFPNTRLIVDGGINVETLPLAKNAGADTFVVGGAVHSAYKEGKGNLRIAALQEVLVT